MNFLKIKLLVIALIVFASSSAFAALTFDVNVDTTSLAGTDGYLYLQYNTAINQIGTSTATVQYFSTDGVLGSTAPGAFANSGNYVTGTLPGTVSISNGTVETNDYNHAITFGNNFHFSLTLLNGTSNIDGSTFSLWLAADALGYNPLKTDDGKLFNISLNADGTATTVVADAGTTVTATPIPAAFWLLGSGLAGLVGVRRRKA